MLSRTFIVSEVKQVFSSCLYVGIMNAAGAILFAKFLVYFGSFYPFMIENMID